MMGRPAAARGRTRTPIPTRSAARAYRRPTLRGGSRWRARQCGDVRWPSRSEELPEGVLDVVDEVVGAVLDLSEGLVEHVLVLRDEPEGRLTRGPEPAPDEGVPIRHACDVDARQRGVEARVHGVDEGVRDERMRRARRMDAVECEETAQVARRQDQRPVAADVDARLVELVE